MLYKITCSFSEAPEFIKAKSKEEAIQLLERNVCDPFCDQFDCDRIITEVKEKT